MKKPLVLLLLVGAIALAAILVLRSPESVPVQAPAQTAGTEPAPAPSAQLPADSSSIASLPVAKPAPAPAPITPATPLVTAAITAATATPAPSGPVTKNPKTLNELYRAFDAINAAAEATTPESLASLVDFAATENADVRTAALNAIINRDDASAAPLLRKAAKQLDDSKAIIALLETADYIELPSTTMTAISARPKKAKPSKQNEPIPAQAPSSP